MDTGSCIFHVSSLKLFQSSLAHRPTRTSLLSIFPIQALRSDPPHHLLSPYCNFHHSFPRGYRYPNPNVNIARWHHHINPGSASNNVRAASRPSLHLAFQKKKSPNAKRTNPTRHDCVASVPYFYFYFWMIVATQLSSTFLHSAPLGMLRSERGRG